MLTIFTPTYNRLHTLSRTYKSLLSQTNINFEWIVVDDGSTDGTEEYILSLLPQSKFPIRFIKQVNSGKHIAYNKALSWAQGDFFICVDSDDWMPQNAVEIIHKYYDCLKRDDKIAGLIALKEYPDKRVIGQPFDQEVKRCGIYELELRGLGGERSIVFKTAIAKKFQFPEDLGEKFMTEVIMYDQYEGYYDFVITNEVLTICEYQIDGLSSNPRKLMVNNPAGFKLHYAQRINFKSTLLTRIGNILRYHAFRKMYNGKQYEYEGKYKFMVALLKPCGIIVAAIYRELAK